MSARCTSSRGCPALQCEGPDVEAGIATASRLLSFDPLQEQAHRALMRLYVADGRQGSALRHTKPAATACAGSSTLRRSRKPKIFTGRIRAQRSLPSSARTPEPPAARSDSPLPNKPSIAVLPFANLSGDAEQE